MSYSQSADQSTMIQESQEAKPTVSNVPDLVKIGQIPTNTAIDIETDILDPVIQTDNATGTGFVRFQLQNKGILHSHSKIIFRYNPTGGDTAFAPLNVGIHSLIQRCRLAVGTKTISEIDDFQHYIAYKSAFLSNEHQKEREQYISGRQIAYRPYYDDWDGVTKTNASGEFYAASDTNASAIGLDNGLSLTGSGDPTKPMSGVTDGGSLLLRDVCRTNASFGCEYAISIQDLFPFLYQNQLPLYMMTEPVTIELTLAPQKGARMCISGSSTLSTEGVAYSLDTSATQLVADYQYFPQAMMEEYARQNADMTFTYMDYRLSKRSINVNGSGAEVSTGQQINNVGGAGRVCTKVIQMVNNDRLTQPKQETSLLNLYHAEALSRDYGSGDTSTNGSLTTNLKYNDNFLYPVDVVNPAYQFHNVVTAEGMVPFVSRDGYANEGAQTTTTDCEFLCQGTGTADKPDGDGSNDKGIVSKFFFNAFKLNRNERVNQRGIELYNTWNAFKNQESESVNFTQRCYVELVRIATLKDGVMESFFA